MRLWASAAFLLSLPGAAMAQAAADPKQMTHPLVGLGGEPAGSVALTDTPNGVLIVLTVQAAGLPAGEHAVHIHETADCSDLETFEGAGDHYDPGEAEHGYFQPNGPHAGDLPNFIVAEEDSELSMFNPALRVSQGPARIYDSDGSALVIHAGVDDYRTQPAGNSGDRIACAELRPE